MHTHRVCVCVCAGDILTVHRSKSTIRTALWCSLALVATAAAAAAAATATATAAARR